jgi:hypothetical protein
MSARRLVGLLAIGLAVALVAWFLVTGMWPVALLVAILALAWPVSERWAREYEQRPEGPPDEPWPSPYEKHRP